MTGSEHSINQTKGELTRTGALEKEVARLKTLSQKQSVKHNKLKKIASFQLLFFVVLLIMMFAYGIIQWPEKQETNTNYAIPTVSLADTTVADTTANRPLTHDPLQEIHGEDMLSFYVPEDGLLFSIQIGAYTGVDMRPYEANMFSLRQYTYQTINQFTVGIFQNYKNAEAFRAIIQQMGFHDAFIIATLNGKRLPIQEALAIKSLQQPIKSDNSIPESTIPEPKPIEWQNELLP
ncbi:MAG: hypothetical protein LC643_03555 [Bacteroidales bacterium]|nr:hypothetical protein [Bacteroidales bacterium]